MNDEAQKKKEELLKRVTGQGSGKLPQVPPPASGGFVGGGNPPLPPGKLVRVRTAASLSDNERAVLTNIGWDDSMPIPKNMAEIVSEVQAEIAAEAETVILPVHPGQMPATADAVAAERKAKLRQRLTVEQAKEQAVIDAAVNAQKNEERFAAMPPSVRAAAEELEYMPSTPTQPTLAGSVVDDSADPVQPSRPGSSAAASKPAAASQPVDDTNVTMHPVTCPHCNWDLSLPDVPEPDYSKRMAFLHTVLGQQCFTEEVELFGGSVVAKFRTLTIREIELAYQQAYRDREVGRAQTEMDFWERVNRYRLFLQLLSLRTTSSEKGFVHTLPDGATKETNNDAAKCWDAEFPEVTLGETILPQIEGHITSKVLRTEALFRVVNSACNQFNRLVAKMEAMVDNSDFWKPTGELS